MKRYGEGVDSMNKEEYLKCDGLELASLVKSKEVSPDELLNIAISLANELNPNINCLGNYSIDVGSNSQKEAKKGPFYGVPFLVKELLPYPNLITSFGSRLFKENTETQHNEFTRKLLNAGFIVFGNTTSSEFALLGSTETELHGITRNPISDQISPGGSSGGSASAVKSGIVPIAHASDGGGSIRFPASVCGLIGFKPSNDRCISSTPQTTPLSKLVVDNCIARSVRDVSMFLSIIEDSNTFSSIGFVSEDTCPKYKIGFYRKTLSGDLPEDDVNNALEETVRMLIMLGHDVYEIEAPPINGKMISDAFFTCAGLSVYEIANWFEKNLNFQISKDVLEPFTFELLNWYKLNKPDVEESIKVFTSSVQLMRNYAKDYDILLCPTLALKPQKIGYLSPSLGREELIRRTEKYVGYTPIHNIAGIPSISLPLMKSKGLPIGMLFSSSAGRDEDLLKLSYQLLPNKINTSLI